MSIIVAFRAFFAVLFNSQQAGAIEKLLDNQPLSTDQPLATPTPAALPPTQPVAVAEPKSIRNDAITLLATLQREARLIDLIQEPLDQYSDAQVGAAARPCLAQCRAALARIFQLQPLLSETEGQTIDVAENASPLRYQWVGEPIGNQRIGKLVHPGWKAGQCELARWTGSQDDALVIAPAQVESSGSATGGS